MAIRELALPGELVKKSNELARCAWTTASVIEPRLVALVASLVRTDDEDFKMYHIAVDDLIDAEGGQQHSTLKDVAKSLMNRIIEINHENGWSMYNVFSKCEYDRENRVISARFDPDLKPHYLQLKRNFTEYSLTEFLLLPSVYSQRLFEILKSWDDKEEIEIRLEDLHKMLNVPDSYKKNFRNFRLRVLEKAHKDIHKKTSLKYAWEAIKRKRTVVAIKFTFIKDKVEEKKKDNVKTKKEIEEIFKTYPLGALKNLVNANNVHAEKELERRKKNGSCF